MGEDSSHFPCGGVMSLFGFLGFHCVRQKKLQPCPSERGQRGGSVGEGLAAQPADPSSIPETNMVERQDSCRRMTLNLFSCPSLRSARIELTHLPAPLRRKLQDRGYRYLFSLLCASCYKNHQAGELWSFIIPLGCRNPRNSKASFRRGRVLFRWGS